MSCDLQRLGGSLLLGFTLTGLVLGVPFLRGEGLAIPVASAMALAVGAFVGGYLCWPAFVESWQRRRSR